MADSFGVKMGIEGEKEFKNALKEINAAFKVLGSEMNLVTSQFDKNEKSIESLTSKNEVLNKEIDTQKEKVETLRSALENASDSFGEADKRTQAWQVQLNNAQALPELIPAIVEAIVLIATTLLDHMDEILQAAFAIIEGLAKGLIEALPVLMDALPELITSIVNFVTENLPEIIELGITLVVELTKGLIQAIPELVKALPQIVMAILEGIGKAILAIGEIGVNIVKGLWEGICSMGSWLYDQVAGFVNGIVENVKSALQIHSPSKVFADIGNNMALGMGVGFSSEMKKVSDDMQNAIPTDFDTAFNKGQGGGIIKSIVEHVGTIRVEGINQSGELTDVVDIIVRQLKQEVRA